MIVKVETNKNGRKDRNVNEGIKIQIETKIKKN